MTLLKFGKYKGQHVEYLMSSNIPNEFNYACWLYANRIAKGYLRECMDKHAKRLGYNTLKDWWLDTHKEWTFDTSSTSYEDAFYGHAFDYPEVY